MAVPTNPKYSPPREVDEEEEPESAKATLVEHLEELRQCLTRSLIFIALGWLVGWVFEPYAYASIRQLLQEAAVGKNIEVKEVFTHAPDAFFLKLKLSFVLGLLLSAPFVIWQLWMYVRPALKRNERHAVRAVVPFSVVLFFAGVGFCLGILKPALGWFIGYIEQFLGAALYQDPGKFVIFVVKMMLAFGLGFQLPIAIWVLARIGLLTAESLWRNWRIAVGFIIIASALITPSGDFFSLAMMATPLALLYFGAIAAVKISERKSRKQQT